MAGFGAIGEFAVAEYDDGVVETELVAGADALILTIGEAGSLSVTPYQFISSGDVFPVLVTESVDVSDVIDLVAGSDGAAVLVTEGTAQVLVLITGTEDLPIALTEGLTFDVGVVSAEDLPLVLIERPKVFTPSLPRDRIVTVLRELRATVATPDGRALNVTRDTRLIVVPADPRKVH